MLSDPMKDAVRYIKYRMRSRKEIEDQLLKRVILRKKSMRSLKNLKSRN